MKDFETMRFESKNLLIPYKSDDGVVTWVCLTIKSKKELDVIRETCVDDTNSYKNMTMSQIDELLNNAKIEHQCYDNFDDAIDNYNP